MGESVVIAVLLCIVICEYYALTNLLISCQI